MICMNELQQRKSNLDHKRSDENLKKKIQIWKISFGLTIEYIENYYYFDWSDLFTLR